MHEEKLDNCNFKEKVLLIGKIQHEEQFVKEYEAIVNDWKTTDINIRRRIVKKRKEELEKKKEELSNTNINKQKIEKELCLAKWRYQEAKDIVEKFEKSIKNAETEIREMKENIAELKRQVDISQN
jgi:acyl-CoA reductase-like NAD-dependent aldehyde dehydrogenase